MIEGHATTDVVRASKARCPSPATQARMPAATSHHAIGCAGGSRRSPAVASTPTSRYRTPIGFSTPPDEPSVLARSC